jgi:hypothetical protein
MTTLFNISNPAIRCISVVLIAVLLVPPVSAASEDAIQNVSVVFTERAIEIHYDLIPASENGKYRVSLAISDDGGTTYEVIPRMIAGDIGRDILPGMNKRIVWFIEREFPAGIDIDRYDFRITAKRQGLSRNILYVLLGAVVAGGSTAAYFLFVADDADDEFPPPPGRPN